MKLLKMICAAGVVAVGLHAADAFAKVSPEEAAKLGKELTRIGADPAGNAEGTIPPYTGGVTEFPAGFEKGVAYPDPFADDKILFTIDQSNVDQHAAKLSAGQVAMIKKYPSYKINVYPSRRSINLPDFVYESALANATQAELFGDGAGIVGFKQLVAFPIPKQPIEVLWSHVTRYRGGTTRRTRSQVTPTASGDYTIVKFFEELSDRWALEDYNPSKDANVIFYFKQQVTSPARLAGNVLLVHETLDQVKEPRRSWIYNAGQRRVRRAPQVAYDGPGTASDGLRTTDDFDMWNGAPDRYDWTLEGKQEIYVPYNSYQLDRRDLKYEDIVKAGHINQDLARYELHRVWKVVGTLKDGARHIYSKREYYVDEDSWQILLGDRYDGRGELWRVAEGHNIFFYDHQTPLYNVEVSYDLLSGRYIAAGMTNEESKNNSFGVSFKARDFTPAALRRSGKR